MGLVAPLRIAVDGQSADYRPERPDDVVEAYLQLQWLN